MRLKLQYSGKALRTVLALGVMVALLTGCLNTDQQSALDALNRDRKANGRRTLVTHDQLQTKAQNWANKIAQDNQLSHSTLTKAVPSCWTGLAENVGYGSSIQQVEDAYMNSPAHRTNIMNNSFTKVGVGVAKNGSRVFTVQVFMSGC